MSQVSKADRKEKRKAKLNPPEPRKAHKMFVSEFYWDSTLTEKRKQEIVEWFNSLSGDEQGMVDALRKDAADAEAFDIRESGGL
jgi:hypothetical protein